MHPCLSICALFLLILVKKICDMEKEVFRISRRLNSMIMNLAVPEVSVVLLVEINIFSSFILLFVVYNCLFLFDIILCSTQCRCISWDNEQRV